MLDHGDPRSDSLAQLDEMVQGAWHRTAAQALLLKAKQESALSAGVEDISISGSSGRGASRETGRPLHERLKEFGGAGSGQEEGYRIEDFPPSLQVMPCKPRLLDLAFDELEFPDLDERAGVEKEATAVEEEDASGSGGAGIRGWVGWALGRK